MRAAAMKTFLLVLLLILFSSPSTARDTLTPTTPLTGDETLLSVGGRFQLGFFNPPNSSNRYIGIWFANIAVQTVVWVANRNNPVTDSGGSLSISPNGTLAIADKNSTVVWSTATPRLRSAVAQLVDIGNFVVREESNADPAGYAWQSFDYPTDTLFAGMKMGEDFKRGIIWNLTAWKSASDPASGEYVGTLDPRGDPEIILWKGSQKVWRTGPWNGFQFSGVPDTKTYKGFTFNFTNNKDELSYSYNATNPSLITRLLLNYTGVAQRFVWVEASGIWNMFWYAPRDTCDFISPCGPYGVCNPNMSPSCSCLQGFTPKSPANWALRDGRGGCVRKTALDCKNGTDGFTTLSGAKLPDTTSSTVNMNMSMSLADCRAACLRNCSCTGFASANVSGGGSGSGCVIWTTELTDIRVYTYAGQDLYIRLAAADLGPTTSQSDSKSNHAAIIIVVCVVLGTLSLGCAGCFIWRRKKGRRALRSGTSFTDHENDESTRQNDLDLPLFDFDSIATATGHFSFENKLGEGGFGPVYKGKLGDEQEIAVKRLAKSSVQGIDEFKTEVMLIAKLQHRNLVRLLGCCIQGEERMLIYEYMPNKSLDVFLFDKAKGALLDWQARSKIIVGIARGLVYLHEDSRLRIIHRDLKASNILLDTQMNPKISDFGMARIFGGDETEANTRRVVGTYGYMSPEYAMDGIFSMKSDVFSFGVLVLEIISGKRNRGVYLSSPHLNLLGHAWSLWNEGNSLEIVDESIGYSFPMNEVLKCIKVGLLCVQEHPEDRPTMSSVLLMLGSDTESLPHPRQPGFVARKGPVDTESSSSKQEWNSYNNISITMLEGR